MQLSQWSQGGIRCHIGNKYMGLFAYDDVIVFLLLFFFFEVTIRNVRESISTELQQ